MAREISFPELARSFTLTIEQMFDRDWMLHDIHQLDIRYLGNQVTLITDGNMIPEYFEIVLDTSVQRSRLRVLDCINEFTTSPTAVYDWVRAEGKRKATVKICTHGAGALETFLATVDQSPYALCKFHIKCKHQEHWEIHNPIAKPAEKANSVISGIRKAVTAIKAKLSRKVS